MAGEVGVHQKAQIKLVSALTDIIKIFKREIKPIICFCKLNNMILNDIYMAAKFNFKSLYTKLLILIFKVTMKLQAVCLLISQRTRKFICNNIALGNLFQFSIR